MMKTRRLIVFFTTLSIMMSCKTVSERPEIEDKLIGQWKFVRASGGFAGKITEADPVNPIVLTFKKDGSFIKTQNADTIQQRSYEFTRIKSIYTGQENIALKLSSSLESQNTYIINIKGDTLSLADNFYDGFSSEYLRLK